MPIQIPIPVISNLLKQSLAQINSVLARYGVDCFISYSWGDRNNKKKIDRLAKDLQKAGIVVFLDLQHNQQINSSIHGFTEKIHFVKYVILAGSNSLMHKYNSRADCILNQEIEKIRNKFNGDKRSVIGVSLNGQIGSCLPDFLKDKIIGSYTNDFDVYAKTTLDLLEYFSPNIIKQAVKKIIKNFNDLILAIKYNISIKNLSRYRSMSPQQLESQIAINVDDLLKKDYLQKLFLEKSYSFEKINSFRSFVCLTHQHDNLIMEKTGKMAPYTHNDLIDHLKSETKRIVIQGDSGVGKTTLCKLIVYLWASNKELLDFKFVFFIKASNLNKSRYPVIKDKKYKEVDIILTECFLQQTLTEISSIALETNIYDSKNNILWIIDESDGSISSIPDHLQDVFARIINNRYVILTSRNHLDKPYDQNYQTIRLSIIGFGETTQRHYIDLFFDSLDLTNNKSIKNNLLHFLMHNYLVKQICLIPMFLEFICNIWLQKLNTPNVNIKITTL